MRIFNVPTIYDKKYVMLTPLKTIISLMNNDISIIKNNKI